LSLLDGFLHTLTMRFTILYHIAFVLFLSCNAPDDPAHTSTNAADTIHNHILPIQPDSAGHYTRISTGTTTPSQLIAFANTLKGVPYKYASTDPEQGLDCSGFIAYVFNHFNIAVPRSSIDFTYVNRVINLKDAKPGDLILFTGTDSTERKVGHMGIIVSPPGQEITFIHSTSGKAWGVTNTPLNDYYKGRYMKTIRIFPHNDR
jgi:cell wall-associated NlpC family hydrolase